METTESLKKLYQRTMQYCHAKYGKEPDLVRLKENGDISVRYEEYLCGEIETHTIYPESLSQDLDTLYAERKAKEEEEERKRKEQEAKARIANAQYAKEQRKRQYEQLKKEFEQ